MKLYLEILEGPDKGKKINLKNDASIGRRGADIILNDAKLSGIHAKFLFDPEKGWTLLDNGSRNGVWVRGIREHEVPISDGLEVYMGESTISCRIIVKSTKKVEGGFIHWLQQVSRNLTNKPNSLEEIKPEMRLRVIRGLQYGESWDVFFGPRVVGKESLDICLYDKQSPEEAFEILVKKRYPYFRTKHPDLVTVNGEKVVDKQLIPGDIIAVGESQLLVEFDNGHGFSS